MRSVARLVLLGLPFLGTGLFLIGPSAAQTSPTESAPPKTPRLWRTVDGGVDWDAIHAPLKNQKCGPKPNVEGTPANYCWSNPPPQTVTAPPEKKPNRWLTVKGLGEHKKPRGAPTSATIDSSGGTVTSRDGEF